jgi:hypothetical protein
MHGSSRGKGKAKLKRSSCALQCSHSSKCSHMGEKIISEKFNQWDSMRSDYLDKCKISDGVSYKPPAMQYPEEDVMDIINCLRKELNLPSKTYMRACRKLESASWARIVLKMDEDGIREWLLDLVNKTDK